MKRAIVAISAFALAMFGGGSAWADPATAARANAYGVDVGGSLLGTIIERTPEVDSVLPPGGMQQEDILPVDADPVALSITGRVVAETQASSTIEPFQLLDNPGPNNARGLAEIESLDVLLQGAEVVDPVDELARNALVSADAVFAEAVGSCQGLTPVYSTDSDVVDLRIAGGQEIQLVDGVVDGVIGLVNDVGDLLPDALRIHIATDQGGPTADGGRFVNALRITVGPTEIDPGGGGDDLLGILDPGEILGSLGLGASVGAEGNADGNEASAGASADADDGQVAIAQAQPAQPLLDIVLGHAEVGALDCPGGGGTQDPGPDGPDALPECSDGVDNDGDGLIDFGADPGCESPQDNDERNQCVDGIDNDGDGLIDFPADPGCASPQDNDERDGAAQCSDGVDNDGDGLIDFGADPGCESPEDDDERNQCVDGIDNDGDGLIDFGADPGCESPQDNDERDGAGGPAGRQPQLPRTGGGVASPLLGVSLLGLAGAAEALRRRAVPA